MMTDGNAELKSFVDRIEALETEKRALATDIKEVYGEAKAAGHHVKALREVIKLRRMQLAKRLTYEEALDEMKHALGMLADTLLGKARIDIVTRAG